LIIGLAAATGAQPTLDDLPLSAFGDEITVRVINLELVVTNRKGERVSGLRPEEFRLRVDGQETPIEFFSEIVEGVAEQGGEALPAAPGVVDGRTSISYLVFIDDFFSIARDRDQVLDAVEEDLEHLGPGDRMAIVAYDGKSLQELTGWTGSKTILRGALEEARGRKGLGLQRMGERRTLTGTQGNRTIGGPGLHPFARSYASRLALQVENSVKAAAATMRSFASPPGRKVMLLLSGGWPSSPADYAGDSRDFPIAAAFETGIRSYSRLLGPLSDTANLLGFTIYPVDVPGMQATAVTSASRRRSGISDRGFYEDNIHDTLNFLAKETGGVPLLNSSRNHALERAAEDTRSYYWLGFTLDQAGSDLQHDLKVEVLRPGLRARARQGFVDMSRQAEIQMTVEGLLLFGNPPNSLPLELRFGKAERERRGILRLPLEVGFNLDEIQLIPFSGRQVADVQIVITVMDDRGNRSETPVHEVRIRGGEIPEPGQRYWWRTELLIRKRKHRVMVAVYDPISTNILSSSVEISP
jgi:VWFA-related protein